MVNLTIPDDKYEKIKEAILYLNPKPEQFTGNDNEYVKQYVSVLFRNMVNQYERKKAIDNNLPVLSDGDFVA